MIFRYHGSTLISASETEVEFSTRLVKNAKDLIIKEGPEIIGAFIVEPVMVAVRVLPPPATHSLQHICLWSHSYESKSSRCHVFSKQQASYVFSDFSHGFTYSAHPFSCAIAIEALKTYKKHFIWIN
ncbi:hypothetical protein IGI04_035195 [Brassica rapa subsp. trilocularis]|uniref:Uncharacterized protein n=1 Tax=Brassica rapa subsp. trilocularis TaxID=1813537 RepID=A0ABQ7LDN5_BRACM|nr:hypothetical protein IGI04_035195 [Brassica rapa subsp. trilocularis]